jgi:LAS superfamily LD-carboxypeptidase LdcB
MRTDFLGDCTQFWELPEAINNGQYLIPRMTRDERRYAITGPVAVGQGAISEPLVNQLLNDVGDNPDQLPILQHALMRTWDYWLEHRRNGEPIDIPDYVATGGMKEALSRHADEAYAELNDARKEVAEKLFKGLTERGADNREIRRPMELQEICELTGANEAEVIAVIEVFRHEGRSFLMPPPTDALTGAPVHLNRESLIDISHESLIRNWERLKSWVDEESRSARIYRRLADTAVLHREGGAGLWRGPDLQVASKWREKDRPNHVWARRYHPDFKNAIEFLDKSRRRRRFLLLLYGLLLVLGIAMLSGMAWYRQRGLIAEAGREADAVRQEEKSKRQQEKVAEQLESQRMVTALQLDRQQEVAQLKLRRQQEIAALQRTLAEERTKIAEQGRTAAESQRAEAERLRKVAEDKTKEAATQRDLAVANGKKLEEQLVKTKAALDEAERQRVLAEEAKAKEIKAREEERIANEKARTAEQQSRAVGSKLQESILEGLKPEAAELASKLVNEAKKIGIEIRLTSGYRSFKDQQSLYGQGRTRPGPVITRARTSTHNTGLAFDVVVIKDGKIIFDGPEYNTLGSLGETLGLVWGGRFEQLKDPYHFQTQGAQEAFRKLSARPQEN